MGEPRIFRHQNYELNCSATADDSGRFVPSVVVCKQVWPTRPRVIDVRRGNYLTEETAIEAARLQGIEWIMSHG